MRLLAVAVLLVGCKSVEKGREDQPLVGPEMSHTPPSGTISEGGELDLLVTAADPEGVAAVVAYHRAAGTEYWDAASLEEGELGWTGVIADLAVPGEEYYFKGTDAGNPAAVAYLPAEGPAAPFSVTVSPLAVPLPFTEDFEPGEDETSLYTMGWWTPSEGFTGYAFQLSDNEAHSGSYCAWHSRGADGTGETQDWLISPALDFTTLDTAMVTWYQRASSSSEIEEHGLYLSTTSRDPADGGFVPLEAALDPAPDGEWERSFAFDLDEWVGEPVVYLAWYYRGTEADDWYIDDVEVRDLAPDLYASLGWSPDPVHPGETATLVVALKNESAGAATDLVATLSLPEGGGTFTDDTLDIGDIPANGDGGGVFELTLDAGLEDDRYLPLVLDVTDGTDDWSFDLQLTVGYPSTGTVSFVIDDAGVVSVDVGIGDPDDPDVVFEGAGTFDAGESTVTFDLTEAYASLPPAAGDLRWFARVEADTSGQVTAFEIEKGGVAYAATVLKYLYADTPTDIWLPEPPDPVIGAQDPMEATPGESGIGLQLTLRNDGADTQGPVTGEVLSTDADATVVGGAFTVDSDIWEGGEAHAVLGVTIDVSAAHVDSTDLTFELLLDDGVESWTLPLSIAVPWPVLKVARVAIDDSGGDGRLDAGETADVEIEVVNVGDLETFDRVDGTLSVAASSTATATIDDGSAWYGSLDVDDSRDDTFTLTVTGGSTGDSLDLELDLTDGTATWQLPVEIVLGEVPWVTLAAYDDETGDSLDGYEFDFVNARYRLVGTELELSIESAVAFDAGTLFVEAWGVSSAASYTYYRWVLQSGSGSMHGYTDSAGFVDIGALDADFPSTTELVLSWDTTDMALSTDSFSIGLAAGWCGPDEYYCDHFPDGWGYPYVGFTDADWFDVEW